MTKVFYRNISVAWLEKNHACEDGIKLFRDRVGGDSATIRFSSDDYKWMKKHFEHNWDKSDIDLVGCFDFDEAFRHVDWLYRRVAANSTAMLTAFAEEGINLQDEQFYVFENTKLPPNYERSYEDTIGDGRTIYDLRIAGVAPFR